MRSLLLSMLAMFPVVGPIGCGRDTPQPAKRATGAPTPREAGPKVSEGTPAAGTANGLDLSFVSDDFFAALILHPARIAKSPIVAPLLEMITDQMDEVGLQQPERVMLFMAAPGDEPEPEPLIALLKALGAEPGDEAFGPEPELGAVVVRLAKPLDVKKRLTEVCRIAMGGYVGELIEKTVQGKTCYKIEETMPMIAFAVDEQTMVITDERWASEMLSAEPKQGPLVSRLRQVDLDNDAVAVVTLDPIRAMIRQRIERGKDELPPALAEMAELPDMLAAITVSVDLSGDTLLEAVLEANNAQGAGKAEELVKAALEMGKMTSEGLKQGIPEEERAESAVGLADEFLAGFGVSRDGALVTVTLKRPKGFDESAAVMMAQAIEAAREAARMAQQSNNVPFRQAEELRQLSDEDRKLVLAAITKIRRLGGTYRRYKGPVRTTVTVELASTQATDADLEHLRALTVVHILFLDATHITGAGLEHIKGMTSLDMLSLTSTQVTDVGLEHLKGLSSLEMLDLSRTKVTGAGLEHIKGMTSLEMLYLNGTQVTDVGLAHLKGLTSLRQLFLNSTRVTDAGLEHLNGLTNLEQLYLEDTQVTDAGLAHLKRMTKLETLYLDGTQVTDVGLGHLKEMTSLRQLLLASTQVTDAGLEHLNGLTNLEHLYLEDTQVTDAGINELRKALPNCTIHH